jgi:hypothetical protein
VSDVMGSACIETVDQCSVNTTQPDGTAALSKAVASPTDEDLHIILAVSNPVAFRLRWQNARDFVERTRQTPNVKLYIVELIYDGQEFQLTNASTSNHLQFRTPLPLFHKENLLSVAVDRLLPDGWKYFAWIDADVEFVDRDGWARSAMQLLSTCKDVLQLASHIIELGPNGDALDVRSSFGYRYHNEKQKRGFFHPGFAWAMTRQAWKRVGSLWSYGILGGGDLVIAWSFLGAINCGVSRCEEDFPELHAMLKQYVTRLQGLRLGFLPGTVLHHFHGERHHRGYQSSWEILRKWQYNPEKHVAFDRNGVLVPTAVCSPQMLAEVREYFHSRREDDAGEEMHGEAMPDESALTSRLPVSLRPKIAAPVRPHPTGNPPPPATPPATPVASPAPTPGAAAPNAAAAGPMDPSFVHVGECAKLLHYYWPVDGAQHTLAGGEVDDQAIESCHLEETWPPANKTPPSIEKAPEEPLPADDPKAALWRREDRAVALLYPLRPHTISCRPSSLLLTRLHEELVAFDVKHRHTPEWTASRWTAQARVRDATKKLFGDAVDTVPFGSFISGLALDQSDLDLKMINLNATEYDERCRSLERLGEELQADVSSNPSLSVSDVQLLKAGVPVLRFVASVSSSGSSSPFRFTVDVSIESRVGFHTTNFMVGIAQRYPNVFRPMTLFLKEFVKHHGLEQNLKQENGGIASYQLQIMLLFHLQVQQQEDEKEDTAAARTSSTAVASSSLHRSTHLGYLLYTFFELFGRTFDYQRHGLRILNPSDPASHLSCYSKQLTGKLHPMRPWLLSIEDSIVTQYDNGASIRVMRRLRRAFALAREQLLVQDHAPLGTAPPPPLLPGLVSLPIQYAAGIGEELSGSDRSEANTRGLAARSNGAVA